MTPLYGVILGFTFSTDQSVMSLLNTIGIKPENMPRAAVRLVNILTVLHMIGWLNIKEWFIHDMTPFRMLLFVSVSPWE